MLGDVSLAPSFVASREATLIRINPISHGRAELAMETSSELPVSRGSKSRGQILGGVSEGLPRTDRTFFSFSDRTALVGAIDEGGLDLLRRMERGDVEVRLRNQGPATLSCVRTSPKRGNSELRAVNSFERVHA